MCKMAPLIGKEMTEKIFLDRYIALCKDKEFYTRKICASHFGKLCSAVGRKTLFRKLVGTSPLFFQLSQIDILFSNRFLILLFYSLTVPCICRSVLRYSVGCPKSVRGRYDASFVLYDSSTPSIIIGRSACHASQRRFEMGANVCLSNFRTIYIHVRETIYRSNL